MRKRRSRSARIAAAASSAFFAGAIVMTLGVWGVPIVMRSPNPSGQHPAERPLAADRKEARLLPSSTATPRVDGNPIRELRNRQLDLPVRGAVRRELHNSFDESRRWFHRHEAIDIVAPRGALVLAVEDGTIVRLFESKAGGTTVYQFDPTTRYAYYYAHLERYADGLQEGDHVQRGQVLGYVGTSGNAPEDTPHLHFAIFRLTDKKQWWQGSPINPYDVFK